MRFFHFLTAGLFNITRRDSASFAHGDKVKVIGHDGYFDYQSYLPIGYEGAITSVRQSEGGSVVSKVQVRCDSDVNGSQTSAWFKPGSVKNLEKTSNAIFGFINRDRVQQVALGAAALSFVGQNETVRETLDTCGTTIGTWIEGLGFSITDWIGVSAAAMGLTAVVGGLKTEKFRQELPGLAAKGGFITAILWLISRHVAS